MDIEEVRARFIRAAEEFSIVIQPVFFASNHLVVTKKGYRIPDCEHIKNTVIGLANGLKDGDDTATTGGIELQIERDEQDEIIDGNLCYVAQLSDLLGESDSPDDENDGDEVEIYPLFAEENNE